MEPKQILIWLHYLLIVNTFVKNDGVFLFRRLNIRIFVDV